MAWAQGAANCMPGLRSTFEPLVFARNQRFKKCALWSPSSGQPFVGQVTADAESFSKVRKASIDAVNREVTGVGLVPLLSAGGGPLAVIGFVVSVCVFSIQRCSSRTLAHVFEKVGKKTPPITHRNTAPAVTRVGVLRLSGASGPHRFPASPRWIVGSWCFISTPGGVPRSVKIGGVASAGHGSTSGEKRVPDFPNNPAVTPAQRIAHEAVAFCVASFVPSCGGFGNYNKSCKAGSGLDSAGRHDIGDSVLCSAVGVRQQPALAAKLTNLPHQASNFWN